MILRVDLRCFVRVMLGVSGVASRGVCMVRGFLMISGLMVLGSFVVVSSSVGVVS